VVVVFVALNRSLGLPLAGFYRALGRPGEFETNLFTALVYNAEDRRRMFVKTFRQATTPDGKPHPYRYLTSGCTANGTLRRGKGLSFPYPVFEQAVLQALSELTPADVLGGEDEGDEREAEIAELTGKLVVMDHRIQDAEQKASDPEEENPEVYVGLLKALHRSKKQTVRRLEELKADAASCKAVNLGEVQSLLTLLASVKGDELKEVRKRLKGKIRSVVSEIWVHITRVSHMQRVAQLQIHLRNGNKKHLVVQHTSGLRAKSRSSTCDKSGNGASTNDAGVPAGI
jgi:hypothetical protein